jgi:predicted cytidylate kinase
MDGILITISGTPCSGKTTVARKLCERLQLDYFSPGEFRNKLMLNKGVSVRSYMESSIEDDDRQVDSHLISVMKKGDVVVDGVYAALLCTVDYIDGFHVFLDAPTPLRMRRCREREKKMCVEGVLREQEDSEVKRGKDMYGGDFRSPSYYDTFLYTAKMSTEKALKLLLRSHRVKHGIPAASGIEVY